MSRQSIAAVGQVISQRREALGFSRIALAYKADVDLRTIERIETGKVEPRRATLAVIEAALSDAEAQADQPLDTKTEAAA